MAPVVTISASFGSHGDKVGHILAERLALPFLPRAIPPEAAHRLAQVPEEVAESQDEAIPGRWERILAGFANTEPAQVLAGQIDTPSSIRSEIEAQLRELADTTGGVIVGRAGMVALQGRADTLCVRLDGPVDRRIAQVVAHGMDEASARQSQREIDKTRNSFARVLFGVSQDDPRLYHVILDSTVLSVDACVDIILRAAEDRFSTSGDAPGG